MSAANGAPPGVSLHSALASLLDLTRLARGAQSEAELGFILVNDSMRIFPYRMAVLWRQDRGISALSGLVQPESNAPYAHWVQAVCRHLEREQPRDKSARVVTSLDLPEALAQPWGEWWPAHALWLPLPPGRAETPNTAAVLFIREDPWQETEKLMLQEWLEAWWHARVALARQSGRWGTRDPARIRSRRLSWLRPGWLIALSLIILAFVPVRLSVLAPGELVPRQPFVLRAPLDGVIDQFQVEPNQTVDTGQALFGFDQALLQSRLNVARQSLATASAEYRQIAQQSLTDPRVRPQLAMLGGRIEERQADLAFLEEQIRRSRVVAPQPGIVLFDDPNQWIGKPVVIGERILSIAQPDDVEIEIWLGIGDAIDLSPAAPVKLFLSAQPLEPLEARLRYMAHESVMRPDGSYAYRLRATITSPAGHRVGLKGTARIDGEPVPLIYWVMRRPIASIRAWIGR
ncbi:MAG: hypothetical protein RL322_1211 [Pseudomonadota bacterium]|jgi:hypothetical protein